MGSNVIKSLLICYYQLENNILLLEGNRLLWESDGINLANYTLEYYEHYQKICTK